MIKYLNPQQGYLLLTYDEFHLNPDIITVLYYEKLFEMENGDILTKIIYYVYIIIASNCGCNDAVNYILFVLKSWHFHIEIFIHGKYRKKFSLSYIIRYTYMSYTIGIKTIVSLKKIVVRWSQYIYIYIYIYTT